MATTTLPYTRAAKLPANLSGDSEQHKADEQQREQNKAADGHEKEHDACQHYERPQYPRGQPAPSVCVLERLQSVKVCRVAAVVENREHRATSIAPRILASMDYGPAQRIFEAAEKGMDSAKNTLSKI